MELSSVMGPRLRVWWIQAILAWWYGRPMLRRLKPLVRAEFAEGDQIAEARFLAMAGYHVAAVSLCRTAIERRVRRAAIISPEWNRVRKSQTPHKFSQLLLEQELWTLQQHRFFDSLYAKLSRIVHDGQADPLRALQLVRESGVLMEQLDSLVLRSLHA